MTNSISRCCNTFFEASLPNGCSKAELDWRKSVLQTTDRCLKVTAGAAFAVFATILRYSAKNEEEMSANPIARAALTVPVFIGLCAIAADYGLSDRIEQINGRLQLFEDPEKALNSWSEFSRLDLKTQAIRLRSFIDKERTKSLQQGDAHPWFLYVDEDVLEYFLSQPNQAGLTIQDFQYSHYKMDPARFPDYRTERYLPLYNFRECQMPSEFRREAGRQEKEYQLLHDLDVRYPKHRSIDMHSRQHVEGTFRTGELENHNDDRQNFIAAVRALQKQKMLR